MAQFWTRKNEQGENKKTISPWEEALRGGDKEQRLPHYNVVAAVIMKGDKVLIVQKGNTRFAYTSGKWEFPGGKIEENESPEDALIREIKEELDAVISVGDLITTVEYDYPKFHLSMDCFLAEVTEGELILKEAEAAKWLTKETIDSVDWLPADQGIIEIVKENIL